MKWEVYIKTGITPRRLACAPTFRRNVNLAPEQIMKAHRGSRGIAPLFFNLDARRRWVVNATPRPLYPWERDPVAGWATGLVLAGAENLDPHRIFFFFYILLRSVLHPYLFLCLGCPIFCPFFFNVQQTIQTSMPPAGFEFAIPTGERP